MELNTIHIHFSINVFLCCHCSECLKFFFFFYAEFSNLKRALLWNKVHMMVCCRKTLNRIRILSYSFFSFPVVPLLTLTMKIIIALALRLNILHSESNARGKVIKPCSFETLNNKRWKTSVSGCSAFTVPKVWTRLAMISALPHTLLWIDILDKENNHKSKSFRPQFVNAVWMLWYFREICSKFLFHFTFA